MPVAAPKTSEYYNACKHILEKFSYGESLSPFENSSFAILADNLKKSSPEDSLQLKAMLALINGDEDSFNRLFTNALLAASNPTIVRSNYAIALAFLGDYDRATDEIRTLLQQPLSIFQSACYAICLTVCHIVQDYDLAEELINLAKRFSVEDPSATTEVLAHLASQLDEDDPLLLTMLDSWNVSPTSEKALQRLESFMTEIGVEHE